MILLDLSPLATMSMWPHRMSGQEISTHTHSSCALRSHYLIHTLASGKAAMGVIVFQLIRVQYAYFICLYMQRPFQLRSVDDV